MTKPSPSMIMHERIRNYFLRGGKYTGLTSKTFIEDYDVRSKDWKKMTAREKSTRNKDLLKAYNTYFPESRNWKIQKMKEDYYGVGIVATTDIVRCGKLDNLEPINSQVMSLAKSESTTDISVREIDVKSGTCTVKKNPYACRVHRMRGPVAFINFACLFHMNVRPRKSKEGNWESWYACRKIAKGEQLFTDYFGGKEEKLPCQFCVAEDALEGDNSYEKENKSRKRKRMNRKTATGTVASPGSKKRIRRTLPKSGTIEESEHIE
jgi:hypothetical protein